MSGPVLKYMLVDETAELLRHSKGTLDNWRHRGEGPPYARLGGRILYDRDAVIEWVRSHERGGTTDAE